MSPRNHADCDAVLSGHSRSLLAQFGLTPKSKRELAAGDVVGVEGLWNGSLLRGLIFSPTPPPPLS